MATSAQEQPGRGSTATRRAAKGGAALPSRLSPTMPTGSMELAEVARLHLPTGYGLASAPDDGRALAFACKPRLVGGVES